MRIIEIRVKVKNSTNELILINADEVQALGEEIKDCIYDDYSDLIEDVTYEIRDDYQE